MPRRMSLALRNQPAAARRSRSAEALEPTADHAPVSLMRKKEEGGSAKPAVEDPSHVFAGPAVNRKEDFAAAGISHGKDSDVVLVAPGAIYTPPPGWDLDCFIYRDGSGMKFAGASGIGIPLPLAFLTRSLFAQYYGQAMDLLTRTPAPGAGTKPKTQPTAGATPVQRAATGPAAPDLTGVQAAMANSGGQTLPTRTRQRMESALGSDLTGVRVHTGPHADRAARDLGASAFTTGQDVYFRQGRFQPGTREGQRLLAHELTHTVQQSRGPVASGDAGVTLSQPGDRWESEAETTADRVASGGARGAAINASAGAPTLALQAEGAAPRAPAPAPAPAAPAPGVGQPAGAAPAQQGAVNLAGNAPLEHPEELLARVTDAGKKAAVPVRVGDLASGTITVRKSGETVATPSPQLLPLALPGLAGLEPALAIEITDGMVMGYATVMAGKSKATPNALFDAIRANPTAMGWLGFDIEQFLPAKNELNGTVLTVESQAFPFKLGGFLSGSGNFGFANSQITFSASADIQVPKLAGGKLELSRDEAGLIKGSLDVPVALAGFTGSVHIEYAGGTVTGVGEVGYQSEKFTGSVTLMLTDAASARNIAREKLPAEAFRDGGAGGGGAAKGDGAKAPAGGADKAGPRALAGAGEMSVTLTDWLSGTAGVIVDSEGHITVTGAITPPSEVELFEQKEAIKRLFTVEARAMYGVPLVGNIFVFANIGLDAIAKLSGKLHSITITGRYSTDPEILNELKVSGTVNISAFAGLRLRAEGGAGAELLGHDIKVGIGLNGLAGIRGYVEGTPTLGYREKGEPGTPGEFFLHGHMEIAAQPFVGLSGDLFVELDSPWWSPAPDEKWTWPIGALEYPLPGQFGIGADVDYVIGSKELPEVQFSEVDFDSTKFMADLMNDKVPKKQGEQGETPGKWTEEAGGAPAAGGGGGAGGGAAGGGAAAGAPAAGAKQEADGKAPAPGNQKRWLEGMQAVQALADRSEQDPLTRPELDKELAALKQQYGFTRLQPEAAGEDWVIDAAMNPKNKKKKPTVQGEPTPRAKAASEKSGEAETSKKPRRSTSASTATPAKGSASAETKSPGGKVDGKGKETEAKASSTGTETDPIPIVWYKPKSAYQTLNLVADDGKFKARPEGGHYTLQRHGRAIDTNLGVNADNFPWKGKTMKKTPVSRKGVTKLFRDVLTAFDYDWSGQHADHVQDLNFGGKDEFDNLWPLDAAINNPSRFRAQVVKYQAKGKSKAEDTTVGELPTGTWVKIQDIRIL